MATELKPLFFNNVDSSRYMVMIYFSNTHDDTMHVYVKNKKSLRSINNILSYDVERWNLWRACKVGHLNLVFVQNMIGPSPIDGYKWQL